MKRWELLRKLRIDNGFTQKEVAERVCLQLAYNLILGLFFISLKSFQIPVDYLYTMVYNRDKKKIQEESKMEFKETFTNGYQIIVNGQEIGFFQFYTGEDELEEPIYLERIDIDEAFRNQGYGTQALRKIASDFGHIYFAADNEDCQRLYERIADRCTLPNADYVDQGFGVYELR